MKRHNLRNRLNGQFVSVSTQNIRPTTIVAGRLYGLNGVVVRAGVVTNGLRLVNGAHGKLQGFVNDSELTLISKDKVQEYLSYRS